MLLDHPSDARERPELGGEAMGHRSGREQLREVVAHRRV
jgi:hypothetical protein